MFDIGALELLVIVIVAVLVIGPKDMPLAMRTAGRWIGKVRKVSSHFRTGIDAMVREAELEDMEKKWKERNEEIMRATSLSDESKAEPPSASAEAAATTMSGPPPTEKPTPAEPKKASPPTSTTADQPDLPLAPPSDAAGKA
ncbi:MAG: Sec-independent protein translocase protein TatB [Pseudomonadota bacterium]